MTKTWVSLAACRDADFTLFFPVSDEVDVTAAKTICTRCPVRPECLDHALNAGESGIWGGTTETERRAVRRGRPAAKKDTSPGQPARVA